MARRGFGPRSAASDPSAGSAGPRSVDLRRRGGSRASAVDPGRRPDPPNSAVIPGAPPAREGDPWTMTRASGRSSWRAPRLDPLPLRFASAGDDGGVEGRVGRDNACARRRTRARIAGHE